MTQLWRTKGAFPMQMRNLLIEKLKQMTQFSSLNMQDVPCEGAIRVFLCSLPTELLK